MANTVFANEVLETKLNEVLTSKLEMSQFLTVDDSLKENPGMIKKVNVYTAAGNVQDLASGAGNTTDISLSYASVPHTVTTTQGRFVYTDEEAMADPTVVDNGINALAKKITNDYNSKAIAQLASTTKEVQYTTAPSFDDFADAVALMELEDEDEVGVFALCNPAMKAEIRKSLKDDMKYIENVARTGYIGSVCGVNLYTSKEVADDTILIATKDAVTAFIKKDTEVKQEREENTRKNYVYGRNVKVIALTDASKAVKITKQ